MLKVKHIIFFLTFVSGLLLFTPVISAGNTTVLAQTDASGLTMQVRPAFNGNFKFGEWLPIMVEIENNGPNLEAEVQVQVVSNSSTTAYTVPVSLPTISRKRITLYIVPNNFSRRLEVQLVSNQQLLQTQTIDISPYPPASFFIGILAPQRGALALINAVELPESNNTNRQKVIVDLDLFDFQEYFEALRSFDLLIINNTDTSTLTSQQAEALEAWVQQGGRLVIGGGGNAERTLAGLPESLKVIHIETTEEIGFLSTFEEYVGGLYPILVPGPFVVATGTASTTPLLVSADNLALLVENSIGNGYIDYIALDLSGSPFDAWNGTASFWQRLISPGSEYSQWQPPDMSARQQISGQMPYALSNIPMLDLPSAQSLAILLSMYILIVGPINYLILRWRNRLQWAWFSIPLITIIFSVGAFGLGYALHGSDLFINKISILKLQGDGKAHITSYLGLFSPSRQTYDIEISGGSLLSSLDPFINPWESISSPSSLGAVREKTISQGNPSKVSGTSVDQWSIQSFLVEGQSVEFGEVISELIIENDTLTGIIHNKSQYSISDAVIVLGPRYQYLGDVTPGEEVAVSLNLSDLVQPDFGPPISYGLVEYQAGNEQSYVSSRTIEIRRIILESIFDRGAASAFGSNSSTSSSPPTFIGWVDEAPPAVTIEGEQPSQQAANLLYYPVSYQLPSSGAVALPAGLIPGILSATSSNGGSCGQPGTTSIYLDRGEATFDFTLPAKYQLTGADINYLKLFIWTDSVWNDPPLVSFYNWRNQDWQNTESINPGINLVSPAGELLESDGLIRLRLEAPEGFSGCYYLGLGLEAWR